MKWYTCLIRGENFLLRNNDDVVGRYGFYTTKWVKAPSPERAETEALKMLQADRSFEPPPGNERPEDAVIFFEEVIEAGRPPSADDKRAAKGATWFLMEV